MGQILLPWGIEVISIICCPPWHSNIGNHRLCSEHRHLKNMWFPSYFLKILLVAEDPYRAIIINSPEHEIAVRAKKDLPAGTSSFLETKASYNLGENCNIICALDSIFQEKSFSNSLSEHWSGYLFKSSNGLEMSAVFQKKEVHPKRKCLSWNIS